jgi:tripartite-type tricarboxylate transporter receptor subunit TctC
MTGAESAQRHVDDRQEMSMIRLSRRTLIGSIAASTLAAPALAQSGFPNRAMKIVVPFGAGGIADITTRLVGEKLTALTGQVLTVINQPGPGGMAAARLALGSESDGYTLALLTNGTAVSAALYTNLQFNPVEDFLPVSTLGLFDFVLVTAGNGPRKSLKEILDYGRANPGKLNVGTILFGSTQHLSATLFKSLTGLDFTHVPYRGTPDLMNGAMRGDVDIAIDSYASFGSTIAAGQLMPLAVSGAKRSASLPNVPTVEEAGVAGYDVTSWNAIFAPKGTPAEIVTILNQKIREAVADPALKTRFEELGIEAAGSTPAELGDKLKSDIAKWNGVIDRAGVQRQTFR